MFDCEWHCNGVIRDRFECDGKPAGVVGLWTKDAELVRPDEESTALNAPYQIRKMIGRSSGFWSYERDGHGGRDVFTLDLYTAQGEPRGCILARLAPEYQPKMEVADHG
jgi:hypothetical protein